MSKLTGYTEVLSAILRCLEGDCKAHDIDYFKVHCGPVTLPLDKVASLLQVRSFFELQGNQIRSSRLTNERKILWSRFAREVLNAYTTVAAPPPRIISAKSLQSTVQHIHDALTLITELMDYDARSPIRSAELVPYESEQVNVKADGFWREVKLESLWPCLLLAVRILEVMLPDRMDFWEEYRESLQRKEWKNMFIIDSPLSRESTLMGPSELAKLRLQMCATRRAIIRGEKA